MIKETSKKWSPMNLQVLGAIIPMCSLRGVKNPPHDWWNIEGLSWPFLFFFFRAAWLIVFMTLVSPREVDYAHMGCVLAFFYSPESVKCFSAGAVEGEQIVFLFLFFILFPRLSSPSQTEDLWRPSCLFQHFVSLREVLHSYTVIIAIVIYPLGWWIKQSLLELNQIEWM